MRNNKRTLKDLSFSGKEGDDNIINLIDRCSTLVGSNLLQKQLRNAPNTYESLLAQQEAVKFWAHNLSKWPEQITNGTIVMLEKFYESADSYSGHPGGVNLFGAKWIQKIFNRNEYHFTHFSLSHLSDFLNGCTAFVQLFEKEKNLPHLLFDCKEIFQKLLQHRLTDDLIKINKQTTFKEIVLLSFHARREMKSNIQEMIQQFALLDTWYGMAKATHEHSWQFPALLAQNVVCLKAKALYHPLVQKAVVYDIDFEKDKNFMMLTGANMSGKTTLMRALGVSAILAHIGMGVPAQSLQISFLDGVITNMHVEDDLFKGESFFLAEVKNMKHTAEAIAHSGAQLVLMDELFKGTNVHDAFECTKAIVEALLLHPNNIMMLSTHLHEIAHHFNGQKGLSFYCFNTNLGNDGNFHFDYRLKEGISDERIGYKILVKEGVLSILNSKK